MRSEAHSAPAAVVNQGVPIYEFALAELLRRGGLDVTQSDAQLAWASEPGNRVLVLVTRSEDDWLLQQGLAQIPGAFLVAVVVKPDLAIYRRALEDIGALAAIGWHAHGWCFHQLHPIGYRLRLMEATNLQLIGEGEVRPSSVRPTSTTRSRWPATALSNA